MKASGILAAVLIAIAGTAYAADFSDLQSFKDSGSKAVIAEVPAPLKGGKNTHALKVWPTSPVTGSYIPNGRLVQIQDVLGCDHSADDWNADDMGDMIYLDGSKTVSAHIGAYSVRIFRDGFAEQDKASVMRICEIAKNYTSGIPGQGEKVLLITESFSLNGFARKYVKGLIVPSTGEVIIINRSTPVE